MDEMHKKADIVLLKAVKKELKRLIPELVKGAMSVDTLRWAMYEAESVDQGPRAGWAKYRLGRAHDDQSAIALAAAAIILEDGHVLVDAANGEPVKPRDTRMLKRWRW